MYRCLMRCRSFIPMGLAKDLYSSLIDPHFVYGCIHYDGCSAKAANALQISQNKALRAVLAVDPRYPRASLHQELNIPNLATCRKYYTVCSAYKGLHDLSSQFINNMYRVHENPRCLRSSSSLTFKPDRCGTVAGSKSLYQRSHVYWSTLPTNVKNSSSLNVFKKSAKSFMFG